MASGWSPLWHCPTDCTNLTCFRTGIIGTCVDPGNRDLALVNPIFARPQEKHRLLKKAFKMTQAKNSSLRDVAQEWNASSEELNSRAFN